MSTPRRRSRRSIFAVAAIVAGTATGVVFASSPPLPGFDFWTFTSAEPPPKPKQVIANIPTGTTRPFIANGVSVGANVPLYFSSGTGPAARNTAAAAGTVERYIDPVLTPLTSGALTGGITITEAQSLNNLARIEENLASAGLTLTDVISMRVFLDNPPGATVADYAGWNRAYRQFFANVDLASGDPVPYPIGTNPPTPPLRTNPAAPSRTTLEVASLPVTGWLVEIEVVARFPPGKKRPKNWAPAYEAR
jgi:enamine deaminase RidA (YjgF/YER057c/UK114 family)